jgi:hypothetical protein
MVSESRKIKAMVDWMTHHGRLEAIAELERDLIPHLGMGC